LRDLKKASKQQVELDKLYQKSEKLAKKIQAEENAKAGKGRSKGKSLVIDDDEYGRASKRKKQ